MSWTADRRRQSLLNHLGTAVTEDEILSFIAHEADVDPTDFDVQVAGWSVGIYSDSITDDELAAAAAAARKVMPAHTAWEVSRTP